MFITRWDLHTLDEVFLVHITLSHHVAIIVIGGFIIFAFTDLIFVYILLFFVPVARRFDGLSSSAWATG